MKREKPRALGPRISDLAVVQTERINPTVTVHEFAIIRKNVIIGYNVTIHPHAVIETAVILGDNVVVHPHVVIEAGVTIGEGTEIFPYTYLGKTPKGAGALARQPIFESKVVIGSRTCIGPNAVIYRDVQIGEGTLIGDGASIREQCRIGSRTVIGRHVTLNYAVIVGSGTKIMDHTWLAGNMTVGNNVFISGGVLTSNDNSMGRKDHGFHGPTIEDGVGIGAGAILLPGVVIGVQAIVGAGAVVTRNVAPHTAVTGVPARVKV